MNTSYPEVDDLLAYVESLNAEQALGQAVHLARKLSAMPPERIHKVSPAALPVLLALFVHLAGQAPRQEPGSGDPCMCRFMAEAYAPVAE